MNKLVESSGNRSVTISTFLNVFFLYLYNLASNVNAVMNDLAGPEKFTAMEDIFLLKYAIFSLIFVNKLDDQHDTKYAEELNSLFLANRFSNGNRHKSNSTKELSKAEYDRTCKKIYGSVLDSLVKTELKQNPCLKPYHQSFGMLPSRNMSFRLGYSENGSLYFLTGCKGITYSLSDARYPELNPPDKNPNRVSPQVIQKYKSLPRIIDIHTYSFPILTALLRTIVGHPQFTLENFADIFRNVRNYDWYLFFYFSSLVVIWIH